MVFHFLLICIFPVTNDVEHIFMCFSWPFVYLVRRNDFEFFPPFLKQIICLLMVDSKSSLHILVE